MIPAAIICGLFGLIIGSFLNVVIIRHGTKGLGGRSGCMSCGHELSWYDNIPVVSWLALDGRCRFCRSKISPQYPLVEAATGILFGLIGYANLSIIHALLCFAIIAYFVIIFVYDLRHTIIPDAWVYSCALLSLLYSLLLLYPDPHLMLTVCIGGLLIALPFYLLWLLSRGTWMGLGDAKLALAIGWLLGPLYGTIAIFLGFIIGALVSAPLLALSSGSGARFIASITPKSVSARLPRGFTMRSEVPFGPFLITACFVVWFLLLFNIDPSVWV